MISTLRRLRQEAAKCKASLDYTVKQADHEVKQERDAGKTRNTAVGGRQTQRNSATKVWQLCPKLDNGEKDNRDKGPLGGRTDGETDVGVWHASS